VTWRTESTSILSHDISYFVHRRQSDTRRSVGLSGIREMRYEEQLEWGGGVVAYINPLNAELNPICHLLTLLGAHHVLHVSRIRVNP